MNFCDFFISNHFSRINFKTCYVTPRLINIRFNAILYHLISSSLIKRAKKNHSAGLFFKPVIWTFPPSSVSFKAYFDKAKNFKDC